MVRKIFSKELFFIRVEEPGESDDDRPVLPRTVKPIVSEIIDDENDNRKQQTAKKKRKRYLKQKIYFI
jgi:hypothetical protein